MKCQYVEDISHGEALGVGQDAILTLKGNLGGVHLENYELSHVASDAGWKKKKTLVFSWGNCRIHVRLCCGYSFPVKGS